MALKGDGWDPENLMPNEQLLNFLDSKVESVKKRVLDATGKEISPIFYSAKYKYNISKLLDLQIIHIRYRTHSSAKYKYNISKLLAYVLRNTKDEKRLVIADNMNRDQKVYRRDDGRENYKKEIKDKTRTCLKNAALGASVGGSIGGMIGGPAGAAIGAGIGAAVGFLGSIFG